MTTPPDETTRVGSVAAIRLAPETGGDPEPVETIRVVAGRGLEYDRYFCGVGISNEQSEVEPSDLTSIEAEALATAREDYDVDFEPGAHRRNVTTRGVALYHLVGEVVLEGTGLCEPCGYMESLAGALPRDVLRYKTRLCRIPAEMG